MKFTMEVNMDNAAFEDSPENELARILSVAAEQVKASYRSRTCQDINGNTVGQWNVEDED